MNSVSVSSWRAQDVRGGGLLLCRWLFGLFGSGFVRVIAVVWTTDIGHAGGSRIGLCCRGAEAEAGDGGDSGSVEAVGLAHA